MAKEKMIKEGLRYPKETFLKAEKFSGSRDILEVVLKSNESYSPEEVEIKLKEFREREVL